MRKSKPVNFQFLSADRRIAVCFAGGKPAFYIPQVAGAWHGIILEDKEAAKMLLNVAESALKHFEKIETADKK